MTTKKLTLGPDEVKKLREHINKLKGAAEGMLTFVAHLEALTGTDPEPAPKPKGGKKTTPVASEETPMGPATTSEEVPAGKLETMNRRELAKLARSMGLDPSGHKAADIRAMIAGGDGGEDKEDSGYKECVITGEPADATVTDEEGNEYFVCQAVARAIEDDGAMIEDFLSGDDEVSNYA